MQAPPVARRLAAPATRLQQTHVMLFTMLLTLGYPPISSATRLPLADAGRSLAETRLPRGNYDTPALNKTMYERYDTYVTPWDDLGVSHHVVVGTWGGTAYQMSIWLRFPCSTDISSSRREVRLVVQLNLSPARKYFRGWAEVVPKELMVDGKLPGILFISMGRERHPQPIKVALSYWDALINQEVKSAALVGHATLEADTFYRMEIEGCERVIQIPPRSCSSASAMFGNNSAWLALGSRAWNTYTPATHAFMVTRFVSHHLKLGFAGLALVVTPHVATGLLANDDLVQMVKQRHIVLLSWDFSFDCTKDINIQVPAQNLVAMAMHGAHNYLGVWDVDEYLVLPRHQPIMHEVRQGCLKAALEAEQEVEWPFELTTVADWPSPSSGEITSWQKYGSFAEAAKHLNYTTQAYAHCQHGCLCKSLVDANTDDIIQVHQLHKPEGDVARRRRLQRRVTLGRSCGYMHHFYHLWSARSFGKCNIRRPEEFFGPRVPLRMQDLAPAA